MLIWCWSLMFLKWVMQASSYFQRYFEKSIWSTVDCRDFSITSLQIYKTEQNITLFQEIFIFQLISDYQCFNFIKYHTLITLLSHFYHAFIAYDFCNMFVLNLDSPDQNGCHDFHLKPIKMFASGAYCFQLFQSTLFAVIF